MCASVKNPYVFFCLKNPGNLVFVVYFGENC